MVIPMSDSISSILSQIRSYQGQIGQAGATATGDVARGNAIQGLPGPDGVQATAAPSFTETLRGALSGVNQAQQASGALAKAFEMGDPSADLAKVMVAAQQSSIAFRATVEVRNRLVQAYQDVMNMPL
ncbi:flagellar hook-basal body complex protein FliE [[Pseudomonas] boreopolis]|uniref:Flagellar hook-basal body complex protein FliE n=2 Tax=Pseudomonadota TaxID=1224 RepID=A0A919KGV3_9XANT|nr:flagellar hook-basal body complex protein FliE [[Pseudomonas] boreopolis]